MVLNLAEIFRYFLQSNKPFVPLAEEMQIVRAYLELEERRLGGRLEVDIRVDEAIAQVLIPALSIQPLVENAIKHGIAQRTEPGRVRIQASGRGDQLWISVENSGGPPAGSLGRRGPPKREAAPGNLLRCGFGSGAFHRPELGNRRDLYSAREGRSRVLRRRRAQRLDLCESTVSRRNEPLGLPRNRSVTARRQQVPGIAPLWRKAADRFPAIPN
jgi:hypothetical protein